MIEKPLLAQDGYEGPCAGQKPMTVAEALRMAIDFIEKDRMDAGYGRDRFAFYEKWCGGRPTSAPSQGDDDDLVRERLKLALYSHDKAAAARKSKLGARKPGRKRAR